MNTKNIYLGLTIVALSFGLSSCNKWLDVEPKSQVRDLDLFSTESGFKEALAGVYASLTYEPLYGKQMTFGLMGVLGYEWDYQAQTYDGDKAFEYQNIQSQPRIDAIWNGIYTAISNDNKLLEAIDVRKSVFSPDNYEVIKGEALALRAFMHFDLLRVFGASYEENPNKMAIPYYKKSSKEIAPQLKVAEVIDLAIADLNEAADLLKRDPLITGRSVSTIDDNGYLMNRQVHLNYYAVKGLLARIYLYKKDLPKALENAETVITGNKFAWVQKVNLENKLTADLTFSTEHLFALNVTRLNTIYENNFTATGSDIFYISIATKDEYYDRAAEDFRYLYLFNNNNTLNEYLQKYAQLTAANWPQAYRNKMPMIKLPEMYFIAAEALKSTNITKAGEMINMVRTHRGLGVVPIDASNFDAVLLHEFRKEFIGEGQLFFYHKRKNSPKIPRGTNYDIIALKGYKLPIPVSEFNNAPGRVDNR